MVSTCVARSEPTAVFPPRRATESRKERAPELRTLVCRCTRQTVAIIHAVPQNAANNQTSKATKMKASTGRKIPAASNPR